MVQLPSIGGFSPLPLAVMAPFMAYQSAELAYAFGLNFELGKRTVKSMSNKQFNALSHENIMEMQSQHHTVSMQSFADEMPRTQAIQAKILDEYLELEKRKIDMNIILVKTLLDKVPEGINSVLGNLLGLNVGNTIPTGPGGAPLETDFALKNKFLSEKNNTIKDIKTFTPIAETSFSHPGSSFKNKKEADIALQKVLDKPKSLYDTYNEKRATLSADLRIHFAKWVKFKHGDTQKLGMSKRAIELNLLKAKTMYNSRSATYYKFLQKNRNSTNSNIKVDANKRWKNRQWKSITSATKSNSWKP